MPLQEIYDLLSLAKKCGCSENTLRKKIKCQKCGRGFKANETLVRDGGFQKKVHEYPPKNMEELILRDHEFSHYGRHDCY